MSGDEETPLAGRRIALTRPTESSHSLCRRLEAKGASVLVIPAIRRLPPTSWGPLDRGIEGILAGSFAGLLFTSAAAIQPFWLRLRRAGGALRDLEPLLIGAVGGGTAAALGRLGLKVDVIPEREDGASLAAALGARLGAGQGAEDSQRGGAVLREARGEEGGPALRGMRFLQPRAEEGRAELADGLGALGAEVIVAPAYRTLAVEAAELAPLIEGLAEGSIDLVIFASPSAVEAVRAAVGGGGLGSAQAVSIGRTTAGAIERAFQLRPTVAASADDEGLAEAVQRALAQRDR